MTGFAGGPCTSTGITERVHIEGDAPAEDLRRLVAHVERIAEIPSAIRAGGQVRLVAQDVVSTRR